MTFNINDNVKVRLTERGREALRQEHERMCRFMDPATPYRPPVEDKDGWSTWPMWALMSNFGDMITNSAAPFNMNIRIDDADLRSEADVASKA